MPGAVATQYENVPPTCHCEPALTGAPADAGAAISFSGQGYSRNRLFLIGGYKKCLSSTIMKKQ